MPRPSIGSDRLLMRQGEIFVLFDWYAFIFVNIDRDGRRARQEAAAMMGGTYDQDFGPLVDSVAAAGTPDEVVEKIEHYVAAGARHLIFLPATVRSEGIRLRSRGAWPKTYCPRCGHALLVEDPYARGDRVGRTWRPTCYEEVAVEVPGMS